MKRRRRRSLGTPLRATLNTGSGKGRQGKSAEHGHTSSVHHSTAASGGIPTFLQGKYTWGTTGIVYEGSYMDNHKSGPGKMSFPDKSFCEGKLRVRTAHIDM
jgi:hypothetical protein